MKFKPSPLFSRNQPRVSTSENNSAAVQAKLLPPPFHCVSSEAKAALDETKNEMAVRLPDVNAARLNTEDSRRPQWTPAGREQRPTTPTVNTLPPLQRTSLTRITADTGVREEKTFVITAPGYDARFADELDRAAAERLRGQLPPDALQSSIYREAVSKCQQWMNKYMD